MIEGIFKGGENNAQLTRIHTDRCHDGYEEFSAYASILAIENAKRLGIKIDIVKETDVETAYIYKHQ